jgi:hypothetical protein
MSNIIIQYLVIVLIFYYIGNEKIKNKVIVLQYKAFFEQNKLIENQIKEGQADLNYYLNHFRKKLGKQNTTQAAQFDKFFFGIDSNSPVDKKLPTTDSCKEATTSIKQNKSSVPLWAKKLYKKIVSITHPDKIQNIGIPFLKNRLIEQYMLTVESYNQKKYENLIMLALDLGLPYDESVVEKIVLPRNSALEKKIRNDQTLLAYHWYHVADDKKEEALKKYLTQLGFKFTDKEVNDVITKRIKSKRKPGTRPVNLRQSRLKSK